MRISTSPASTISRCASDCISSSVYWPLISQTSDHSAQILSRSSLMDSTSSPCGVSKVDCALIPQPTTDETMVSTTPQA